jgi:hypothetical protein
VKHGAAKTALQDREEKLDGVAELIERDLMLLGATAIEDKLQQVGRHALLALRNRSVRFFKFFCIFSVFMKLLIGPAPAGQQWCMFSCLLEASQ